MLKTRRFLAVVTVVAGATLGGLAALAVGRRVARSGRGSSVIVKVGWRQILQVLLL